MGVGCRGLRIVFVLGSVGVGEGIERGGGEWGVGWLGVVGRGVGVVEWDGPGGGVWGGVGLMLQEGPGCCGMF